MTIRELATQLIDHADTVPGTIDLARAAEIISWLDPAAGLPDDLTPEAFMDAWNDIIRAAGKIRVQFEAGTSRSGDYGVNYLITAPSEDIDLYAEIRVPDGASDDFGYLALKQEILQQAEEAGVDPDRLAFQYDGQEDMLHPDADGTVRGPWYAVQRDREDDWNTGSYDREEALEMARKLRADYPDALIAVIDNRGDNPVCVDEITEF